MTCIPLSRSYYCEDCNVIGDKPEACANCLSQSLMPLAGVLNRKPVKSESAEVLRIAHEVWKEVIR